MASAMGFHPVTRPAASVWMMQYSIMSVGTYGVGVLSEAFGPQWALGGMAAALVVLMGVVWLTVPLMRRIE